jgi:hypothetical protein
MRALLREAMPTVMNRPVYILGAGFCVDFDRTLFPLAGNFLRLAKAQHRYEPERAHEHLSLFIAKYFGDDSSADIERVLSFLGSEPFDRSEDAALRLRLYDQLVMIIANTLNAASASVAGRSSRAPLHRGQPWIDIQWDLYSRFAEELVKRQAFIITFNYDLLVEFLLRSTGVWNMADGYGIDIPLINELLPPELGRSARPEPSQPSSCVLLKLHGSINWGAPIELKRGIAPSGVLRQILAAPKLYRTPEDLKHGIMNFHTFTHQKLKSPIVIRPVIVPPVLDKSGWLKNRAIGSLWKKAAEAIRDCEEITMIGYSLPATDFLSEFLLRESFHNPPTKRVTLVSPHAKQLVSTRFASVFGNIVDAIDLPFIDWVVTKTGR